MDIQHLIEKIEAEYDELAIGVATPDSNFKELIYWNSMNSLVLVVMVEYEYKVILTETELKNISTIRELAKLITTKQSEHGQS